MKLVKHIPISLLYTKIYPLACDLELPSCRSLPLRVIISTQDIRVEALLNIFCWQFHFLQKYNFCCQDIDVKARCDHFPFFEVYRLAHGPDFLSCQKKTDFCGRGVNVNEKEESIVLLLTLKWNVFTFTAYKVVFLCVLLFCPSATNQYQLVPIYLLIGIDNR